MSVPKDNQHKSYEKGQYRWTPERMAAIRERYSVDPETGDVVNLKTGKRIVNHADQTAVAKVSVLGKWFLLHHIVWFLTHGEPPPAILDHINRDPARHAPANLRPVTAQQNGSNRRDRAAGACRHPYGVHWLLKNKGMDVVYHFSNQRKDQKPTTIFYRCRVLGLETAEKIGAILNAAVMRQDQKALEWINRPLPPHHYLHWNGFGFEILSKAQAKDQWRTAQARRAAAAPLDQALFAFMETMEVKHAA